MEAYGYKPFVVDPQDLDAMAKTVEEAKACEEPACIITRRPCVLLKRAPKPTQKCVVNTDTCKGCKKCLGVGCPAVAFHDGKAEIDPTQCIGCTVCAQVCPFKAIETQEL